MITASLTKQATCQKFALHLFKQLRKQNALAFEMMFVAFEKTYNAQHRHAVESTFSTGETFGATYEMLDRIWVECLGDLGASINTERAESEYCGRFGFDIFTDSFYDALTEIATA